MSSLHHYNHHHLLLGVMFLLKRVAMMGIFLSSWLMHNLLRIIFLLRILSFDLFGNGRELREFVCFCGKLQLVL